MIRKTNINRSVLGATDNVLYSENNKSNRNNQRMLNSDIQIPIFGINISEIDKIDSANNNNLTTVKDSKTRIRPMSMKHPRLPLQRLDKKDGINLVYEKNRIIPNYWNSNNFAQTPLPGTQFKFNLLDQKIRSVGSPKFKNSRDNKIKRVSKFGNSRKRSKRVHSPSAVLDLSKPILSLRNQSKEDTNFEVQIKVINQDKKQDIQGLKRKQFSRRIRTGLKKKRLNSAVHSSKSHMVPNQRFRSKHKYEKVMKNVSSKPSCSHSRDRIALRSSTSSNRPLSIDKSMK